MERITDKWNGLERRERTLAIVAVAVLALVVLAFVLLGGSDPAPPVDASTAVVADAAARAEGDVPAMVVGDNGVNASTAPASPPRGVSGLAVSGGSGGGGNNTIDVDHGGAPPTAKPDPNAVHDDGLYHPPVVSDAVKEAGRALERVGAAYDACMAKAHAAQADSRHCVNDSLKDGVVISPGGLHRNDGLTLATRSSDGHTLYYTVFPPPKAVCRVLDESDSCSGWVSH